MGARPPFSRAKLSHYPRPEVDFVAALVRAQETSSSTDADFTKRDLNGLSLSLWRKTRNGRRPLGWALALAGADLVPYSITNAAHESLKDRARRGRNGQRPCGDCKRGD